MKLNNFAKLATGVVISELAGVIGSVFTAPSIPTWYAGIVKPTFNPPAWVFGPVWTTLFAFMGIAVSLVYIKDEKKALSEVEGRRLKRGKRVALTLFGIQLALNIFWSIIFFGLHSPGAALFEIVFLWLAIVATIIAFSKISKPAAWLLLPYILWVSFAMYLNYSIYALN